MDKFLGICGIAKKAGKIVFGLNETIKAMKAGKVFIVICAFNASEKTLKEAEYICNLKKVELIKTTYAMEEMGKSIGEGPVAVISVTDAGLARTLKNTISGNIITGGAKFEK